MSAINPVSMLPCWKESQCIAAVNLLPGHISQASDCCLMKVCLWSRDHNIYIYIYKESFCAKWPLKQCQECIMREREGEGGREREREREKERDRQSDRQTGRQGQSQRQPEKKEGLFLTLIRDTHDVLSGEDWTRWSWMNGDRGLWVGSSLVGAKCDLFLFIFMFINLTENSTSLYIQLCKLRYALLQWYI